MTCRWQCISSCGTRVNRDEHQALTAPGRFRRILGALTACATAPPGSERCRSAGRRCRVQEARKAPRSSDCLGRLVVTWIRQKQASRQAGSHTGKPHTQATGRKAGDAANAPDSRLREGAHVRHVAGSLQPHKIANGSVAKGQRHHAKQEGSRQHRQPAMDGGTHAEQAGDGDLTRGSQVGVCGGAEGMRGV